LAEYPKIGLLVYSFTAINSESKVQRTHSAIWLMAYVRTENTARAGCKNTTSKWRIL